MEKAILTALLFTCSTAFCLAQSHDKPMGPKAKNYKFWKDKDAKRQANTVTVEAKALQGPKAKNTPAYERAGDSATKLRARRSKRIMGPRAKNTKPTAW